MKKELIQCKKCHWLEICHNLEYGLKIQDPCDSFKKREIPPKTYSELEVLMLLSDYAEHVMPHRYHPRLRDKMANEWLEEQKGSEIVGNFTDSRVETEQ